MLRWSPLAALVDTPGGSPGRAPFPFSGRIPGPSSIGASEVTKRPEDMMKCLVRLASTEAR